MSAHIGERLRAHYEAVLKEPIPDRFLELLQKLEEEDPKPDGASADGDAQAGKAQER